LSRVQGLLQQVAAFFPEASTKHRDGFRRRAENMTQHQYLMESEEESIRLDLKTDPRDIQKQARWAGIRAGMRVGDLGCGPGKMRYYMNRLVQPGGSTLMS